MICGTTHTHASPLLLRLLLNSSCLPCASPTELSARWMFSSSHQIPNKRSLLYGSDTGSTQGSPQRDRDRENEIRVWTQIRGKRGCEQQQSQQSCMWRASSQQVPGSSSSCVRACVRAWDGVCFLRRWWLPRNCLLHTFRQPPPIMLKPMHAYSGLCLSLLSPSPGSSTCLNPTHPSYTICVPMMDPGGCFLACFFNLVCLLLQLLACLLCFVCNKMLYVHFSHQLQQQLHLWFGIKEGEEERSQGGRRGTDCSWRIGLKLLSYRMMNTGYGASSSSSSRSIFFSSSNASSSIQDSYWWIHDISGF